LRRMIPLSVSLPDHEQSLENARAQALRVIQKQLDDPLKKIPENDLRILVLRESPFSWFLDEDEQMLVDEKVARHVYNDGTIDFETILDRPLRGLPCINEHMYGRMGLCPIACSDLTSAGGCVVAQLVETVMKRERKYCGWIKERVSKYKQRH